MNVLIKESVQFKMSLLQGKIMGIAAAEEVHICCSGVMPDCGEILSVPCTQRDTGAAFTVSSSGISEFVLNKVLLQTTTTTTTFTITTYFELASGIFDTSKQQAVRTLCGVSQNRRDHYRGMAKKHKNAILLSRGMLRL